MERTRFAGVTALGVFAVFSLAAPERRAWARGDTGGYFDLLSPEVVGETGSRTYDLKQKLDKDTSQFAGNQEVKGGTFLGAGFGMRGLVALPSGAMVGAEWLVTSGRIKGAELPWAGVATATHADVLFLAGYGLPIGPMTIHALAVFGGDYMSFDVAGGPGGDPKAAALGYTLSRWDLRMGLQAGAHVQIHDGVALFADATFDYDGQYRVQFGISFGRPRDN